MGKRLTNGYFYDTIDLTINKRYTMIRYIWKLRDVKNIYATRELKREDRIELPYSALNIYVNILERYKDDRTTTFYRVKLFYSDGTVFEGWTTDMCFPISIMNEDELFDGRFNQ